MQQKINLLGSTLSFIKWKVIWGHNVWFYAQYEKSEITVKITTLKSTWNTLQLLTWLQGLLHAINEALNFKTFVKDLENPHDFQPHFIPEKAPFNLKQTFKYIFFL